MTELPAEGPNTAAYDLSEARFRIHEVNRDIRNVEMGRRHTRTTLVSVGVIVILVVLTLNLLRIPRHSPVRLDSVTLTGIDIAVIVAIIVSFYLIRRFLAKKTMQIEELRLLLAKLREAERDAKARIPAGGSARLLWAYHSDVMSTIEEYRVHALGYRKIHNRYQTVIIIGSLLTSAITTAAVKYASLEWVAVAISFAVGVSAGMTGYFKFRERSMNMQQAADQLEYEHKAVELGIRTYRGLGEEERLVKFAERAEDIKDDQRKREQQLEQPPEARSTTGDTTTSV